MNFINVDGNLIKMSKIQIIIKSDDKKEPIFRADIPLTPENLNGIVSINKNWKKIISFIKNIHLPIPKDLFEKIQEIFQNIINHFTPNSSEPLLDRENAIEDFPPFTEQEIDEALKILEKLNELYKCRY